MKRKPVVGETLFSLNIGNAARRVEQVLTPVTVTKVGRKYFTCKPDGFIQGKEYYVDDWSEKTDYSSTSRLFESEKEWEDEKEHSVLLRKLRDTFYYYHLTKNLTLDDLRNIDEIIVTANGERHE